ncbi:MAG: Smr/MutS family protein [Acidobacteriota bacterium]
MDDDDDDPGDPDAIVEIPVEDAIDLHAIPPSETAAVVASYVEEAAGRGFREVRIIHGRGTGTQRAIARRALERSPFVIAFADATPDRGGWGATIAYLKAGDEDPGPGTNPGRSGRD